MKRKSLLLTAVATLGLTAATMAQTVPNYVPTNGLVGWWPFNGNANDESGNGNNGTVNGATLTSDRFGNANQAYSFDGIGNSIIISDSPSLRVTSGTISCWIKFNSFAKMQLIQKINFNNAQSQNYDVEINEIPGNILIRGNYGVQCNDVGVSNFCSTNSLTLNNDVWHHYIGVMDITTQKIYIDGILMGSWNLTGQMTACIGGDLLLGRGWVSYPLWYQGLLDDLAIYNRALTPQEISDLFLSSSCNNSFIISPSVNSLQTGGTANFIATTSDANASFVWQSDFGQGFQTLNDIGNYSGANSNTLSISNVQLANHNQPIRAISSNTNCIDTSNVATIQIADTCITTIYDTLYTTVTDTLIINTTLSLPAPNNENTILIYPNPASDHITIDNGNYTAMAGYSIKIENNAGQQVFQSAVNQPQFYIDLSTWSGNGLYFVHLIDPQNNTLTVRKIVLQ